MMAFLNVTCVLRVRNAKPLLGMLCLLLCFLLTGCPTVETTTQSSSFISISNREQSYQSPSEMTPSYEALVCATLRGKITFPLLDVTVKDVTVEANTYFSEAFPKLNARDDSEITPEVAVAVESWCYGASNNEIGYAKLAGFLNARFDGTVSINAQIDPPNMLSQTLDTCPTSNSLIYADERGQPPCIWVMFLEGETFR